MDRDPDGLTRAQGFALLFEMNSARQLLAFGESTLRNTRLLDPSRDAILTTTSIGVEKLLKVALGLMQIAEGDGWPSKAKMRDEFGHGVTAMDARLREHLDAWLATREGPSFVHGLVEVVRADAVWPRLLDALDAYGRSGRFYYLNALAESTQPWESPTALWDATEQAAIAQHAEIRALLGGPTEALNRLPVALHHAVADSLLQWWTMVAWSARHGALGDRGRQFGFEAHPDSALRPGAK